MPFIRDPRELNIIRAEMQGSSVTPSAKDESLPLFQQNLKVLTNMSKDSNTQYTESKSILSGIQQELKNIAANTRQSKEGLKEASAPTVEKGEDKESLREIKSCLGVISTAITTLVDIMSPLKDTFGKLLSNTEKQVQAAVLSNELSKTQHKLSAEAAAKQHKEHKELMLDLDADLEYQTSVSRQKELAGEKKEGDSGRAEKAKSFAQGLFDLLGLKPVGEALFSTFSFLKDGFALLAGVKFAALATGLGLVASAAYTAYQTFKLLKEKTGLEGDAEKKAKAETNLEIQDAMRDKQLRHLRREGKISDEQYLAEMQKREREKAKRAEQDAKLAQQDVKGHQEAGWAGKNIPLWGRMMNYFTSPETSDTAKTAGLSAVVGGTVGTTIGAKRGAEKLLGLTGDASKGATTSTTTTISKAAQEQLKHFDDLGKKAADVSDDILKQTAKTEGYFARFYKTVKNTTSGALKSVSEKAGKAVDYVRSGVGKVYNPVKDTLGKLTEKAGGALKSLGRRGGITLPKMPSLGGMTKTISSGASKTLNATKGVLKGVASKLGPIIAAGMATHEASGLAGEGDYWGAAKALAKGGISFTGGLIGGAVGGVIGTAAGPAGTVVGGAAGSVAGSMAAEKAADWILGDTKTKKDEVPETVGKVKSEENVSARKEETLLRMKEARAERYNELIAEGKSTPEIKKIIQSEFKNLNSIMAKENGVSESVIEESEKKTTDAIVELSSKTESLAEAKDKKDEINNGNMDSWLDRIYDFLKNDFISGIAGLLGITVANLPQTYSGTQGLQPKLGSAATPTTVENAVEPLPQPTFTPQQIPAKTTEGTVPAGQPFSLSPEISTGLAAVSGIMPQDMQAAISNVMPAQPQAPSTTQKTTEKSPNFQEVVSAEANLSAPNIENKMEAVAPLPSGFTKVTSPYGPRKDVPPGASTDHKAIDLGAPTGTPVFSVMDGKVTGLSSNWGGVYVAHDNGLASQYLHLSRFNVGSGQKVKRGDVLGLSGATQPGTIKGMKPHLHFGLTQNGSEINPLPFLQSQAGFSPTYASKDIERRALSAAGVYTAQEAAKKAGASSVTPNATAPASAPSAEGTAQPGEQGLIASGIEKATGLGKTAFETMMSLGATTAASVTGMIPDKYLPKDMKASLEKMKTNKTADWTTAAGQFTNDDSWKTAGMGADISGMRMGVEERVKASATAAPATAPSAAQAPMENNTGAQMKQIMSGFTQSMAAMQSAMAGAGGNAQVSSSGPMIDDISLQMLQKFFLGD